MTLHKINTATFAKEEIMTSQEKKQLQITACKVRMGIIASTHAAKYGHPGGSLSAADMFTYQYN